MNFTVSLSGFDSEFNGDATGWEVHSGTWWIQSNAWYTTQGLSGMWSSVSYAADFTNFDYRARLWRNGCDGCANNILIRGTPNPLSSDNDWYSAYAFQYTRNGSFSVWKGVAGTWTSLQNWASASAINQGSAWNTLRVVANGSSLYFYINGTLVWSGSDTSLSSGRVGIEMYSDGTSGDQLWVDWATLTTSVLAPINDRVSDEQQALNDAANKRDSGSKYVAPSTPASLPDFAPSEEESPEQSPPASQWPTMIEGPLGSGVSQCPPPPASERELETPPILEEEGIEQGPREPAMIEGPPGSGVSQCPTPPESEREFIEGPPGND